MANSIKARFNDDCKVFVSMSDDTTVEKAVIIDAEGNETDIGGGGGSSDFSTATVKFIGGTVDLDKYPSLNIIIINNNNDKLEFYDDTIQTGTTTQWNLVLYKGEQILGFAPEAIESYTGSVTIDQDNDQVIVTGEAEITVYTPNPIG